MGTTAQIHFQPQCDFCADEAQYDAKTTFGPWAYMCESHWKTHSTQRLGTGFGQRLEISA